MVYYLIYTSEPTIPMTMEVLNDITTTSIRKNGVSNITGVLLGIENKYMQYLEGGKKEVNELYEKLKKDSRHKNLVCWMTGDINERVFTEWSMASWMLSKEELENAPVINDLRNFLRNSDKNDPQPKRFIALMNALLKVWIENKKGENV